MVLFFYVELLEVKWYKGMVSVIYENFNYLNQYDFEYVLILLGDYIYKMDYGKMFDFYIEKKVDVMIFVIEVSWEEVSWFGIMKIDVDGMIIYFDEKFKFFKSNFVLMGIYIFNWLFLKQYFEMDDWNFYLSYDFGKDIIFLFLEEKKKFFVYLFKGYWKDVGIVQSLWEVNMDLLKEDLELKLFEWKWKIYFVNLNQFL